MEVYVVTAKASPQSRLYWVIGAYTDEARAHQVARDFRDLEPMVACRTVDERTLDREQCGCGCTDDVDYMDAFRDEDPNPGERKP